MHRSLRIVAASLFVLVAVACSSSSSSTPAPAQDNAGSCALLASRCHPVKTTLGKECHELGHDGDDAKCGPRKAECLAECPEGAGDDGGPSDHADAGSDAGGEQDASTDAPSDPCPAYCTCMLSACAAEFAGEAECLAACAGFAAKDMACFAQHCEDAKTAPDPAHDCEHASGAAECH